MEGRRCRLLIACVGTWLRRDDAAGLLVYRLLRSRGVDCVVECEHGLEHCVDVIVAHQPELLVVVDAVVGDYEPGTIVVAEPGTVTDPHLESSHTIPLHLVLDYLSHRGVRPRVLVVGVAVKDTSIGVGVSDPVARGCERLAELLEALAKLVEEQPKEQ